MKRREVRIVCRIDNSLRSKVDAIKAESYGAITNLVEQAIKDYKLTKKEG